MSKGNIISDIKREEKESRKTKLAATTKVFFPYSITGQWLRSIEDKREDRALWRTASVILAILIPHYDAPPSSCNTSSLRPRVIGQRGRGGWNARNPETRLLEVSPWVIVTRCLEAEEIHDNTGRPPKTLREECPTKWHLECSAFNPLHRHSAPTTTFLLLSG